MGYYIRTTRSGRQELVRSNSYSHSSRHHHHKCFDDCAGRSVGEWEVLLGQNANLLTLRDSDAREAHRLKAELQAAQAEVRQLRVFNQQSIDHNVDGDRANRSFRHRVQSMTVELERKDRKIHRLERENGELVARETEHLNDIGHLRNVIEEWRRAFQTLEERYHDARNIIRDQGEQNRRYRDLLRRHGLL